MKNYRRVAETQSQAELGTRMGDGVLEYWSAGGRCKMLRVVTHCFAEVHESPRKFAQIRAVVTRCYALLRVRLIFWPRMKQVWEKGP